MEDSDSGTSVSGDFSLYELELFEGDRRPSMTETKSRLVAAVVRNEVDTLKELLDSPKWYKVRDNWGFNLLQIAILKNSVEAFDYLLSLPGFPLEYENKRYEKTALPLSLEHGFNKDPSPIEHFSYELVKRGVALDKDCDDGNTPLFCALRKRFFETAELLIQRGEDVNACNSDDETPLDKAVESGDFALRLLLADAHPTVANFEQSILMRNNAIIQESLFLYLFDEFSDYEMRLEAIIKLAARNVPLFYEFLKFKVRAVMGRHDAFLTFMALAEVGTTELEVVLGRYSTELMKLADFTDVSSCWECFGVFPLANLEIILRGDFGRCFMEFDGKIGRYLARSDHSEELLKEQYCLLLSYNMKLTEHDVVRIFQRFGYCELFKIFLHMDIERYSWDAAMRMDFLPFLIFDVKLDVQSFLRDPGRYSGRSVEELMKYFAHPRLKEMHFERAERGFVKLKEDIPPEVPSLVEVARNEFRRFLVRKLPLKTSRQFYTYLNSLPIGGVHRKIFSYEMPLYC